MFFKGTDKPNAVGTLVVTDFSKAFDCVDHTLAIQKLCDLGVRSEIIPWITNILAYRRQRFQYRSHMNFLGELKHPCRHDAQNDSSGVENYTHFFHKKKKINISTTIYSFFFSF